MTTLSPTVTFLDLGRSTHWGRAGRKVYHIYNDLVQKKINDKSYTGFRVYMYIYIHIYIYIYIYICIYVYINK